MKTKTKPTTMFPKPNGQVLRRTNYGTTTAEQHFQDWASINLPDRKVYFISDVDLVIRSKKGCIYLIEIKRKNKGLGACQSITLQILDYALRNIDNRKIPVQWDGKRFGADVKHRGLHVLQFANTTMTNGAVKWDGKEVSENELKDILSFKYEPCCF